MADDDQRRLASEMHEAMTIDQAGADSIGIRALIEQLEAMARWGRLIQREDWLKVGELIKALEGAET